MVRNLDTDVARERLYDGERGGMLVDPAMESVGGSGWRAMRTGVMSRWDTWRSGEGNRGAQRPEGLGCD